MAETGVVLTYREFEARANQAAHLFRETGLERLDHVAFLIENEPVLPVCNAGAERTGLLYTPINHHLSAEQVAHIVNDCQARIVVTTAAMADVAVQLPERCLGVRRWLMADHEHPPAPFESYT